MHLAKTENSISYFWGEMFCRWDPCEMLAARCSFASNFKTSITTTHRLRSLASFLTLSISPSLSFSSRGTFPFPKVSGLSPAPVRYSCACMHRELNEFISLGPRNDVPFEFSVSRAKYPETNRQTILAARWIRVPIFHSAPPPQLITSATLTTVISIFGPQRAISKLSNNLFEIIYRIRCWCAPRQAWSAAHLINLLMSELYVSSKEHSSI